MNYQNGIYFERPGDKEFAEKQLASFRTMNLQELVDRFNREVRVGITGVHMQLVYITTLNQALNERTGQDALGAEGPMIRPLRFLTIEDGKLLQQTNN